MRLKLSPGTESALPGRSVTTTVSAPARQFAVRHTALPVVYMGLSFRAVRWATALTTRLLSLPCRIPWCLRRPLHSDFVMSGKQNSVRVPELNPPEDGRKSRTAWLQVLGAFCLNVNTW